MCQYELYVLRSLLMLFLDTRSILKFGSKVQNPRPNDLIDKIQRTSIRTFAFRLYEFWLVIPNANVENWCRIYASMYILCIISENITIPYFCINGTVKLLEHLRDIGHLARAPPENTRHNALLYLIVNVFIHTQPHQYNFTLQQ